MEIRAENVHKKIADVPILKNMNAVFSSDKVNVIVGPNGAGKTTLMRLICMLDTPTKGRIFYDNVSSTGLNYSEKLVYRRRIGFVFQNPTMLSGSVYDNIIYGLKVRKAETNEEEIHNVIRITGLSDKVNYEAKNLSGGEKQRLSLARVLVLNPDVLLLDEPTANLDPVSVKTVENIIMQYAGLKTIILSTHNLFLIRRLSNKLFFIKNGEIIQEGMSGEVFNKPLSLDIAEFSASENIIYGDIVKEDSGTYLVANGLKINIVQENLYMKAIGILRPEDIILSKVPISSSARNCFKGIVKNVESVGPIYSIIAEVKTVCFSAVITKQSFLSMNLKNGDEIYITFKATSVHLLEDKNINR